MYLLKDRFPFKSLVFHALINQFLIDDLIRILYGFLFVFLEILSLIAVLERYVIKNSMSQAYISDQDKILEILVLKEDSFITDLFPVQYHRHDYGTCRSQRWI